VPVQSRAFVPGGHVRQPVRCLDREYLENLHVRSLRRAVRGWPGRAMDVGAAVDGVIRPLCMASRQVIDPHGVRGGSTAHAPVQRIPSRSRCSECVGCSRPPLRRSAPAITLQEK
jgi:hypothetical protein